VFLKESLKRRDMNNREMTEKIMHYIHLAQACKVNYEVVFSQAGAEQYQHEFLFFIKPEITLLTEDHYLQAILELTFSKLKEYELQIKDIRILAASYLEKHDIIARHYGVINALSRKPQEFLSDEARGKFRSIYGKETGQVDVLGSIEFLQRFPFFDPFSLDDLWRKSKTEKLAGGCYCASITLEGKEIYLINGFHPKQLIHFTQPGRCIVSFTLAGNTDWAIARNNFIGKTNPAEALPGSLRNELLIYKDKFGCQNVSASQNGFHLSAGPVEGLVELIRYVSDHASGELKSPDDFTFGRQLSSLFSLEQIVQICDNHLVEYQGRRIRTFDLTEEKNSFSALQLLKESTFL
jgi:hypothetical protein